MEAAYLLKFFIFFTFFQKKKIPANFRSLLYNYIIHLIFTGGVILL